MRTLGRITTVAAFTVFLLLAWGPILALFGGAVAASPTELLSGLIPGPRRAWVLVQTIGYAMAVAVFATCAGTAAALYCWRRNSPLAKSARYAALLTASIPPYLQALAWLPVSAALPGHGAGEVTGWLSAVWVESLAVLPFCFGLAYFALDELDTAGIEAARVLGGDRKMLLRIVLPLLAPACLASACLASLLTLADHSTPSLFSRSTYAMEVFEEFSASHDARKALLIALPLVAISGLTLIPLARFWQKAAQRRKSCGTQPEPLCPGRVASMALRAGAVLTVLPAIALFVILLREAAHPAVWVQAIAAGAGDLATSVQVAVLAAVLASLPALVVSRKLSACPRGLWWLVAVPLAMPSALTGAGLIFMWNRDLPVEVYGSFWMLVLASLARFAPLAVLVLAVRRTRMDPALLEAAAIFGSPPRAFLRVELPMLSAAVAAGAAAVFALSLAELGASLLVAPPGRGTLALRIFNYLHYGASGAVAALAFCLMAATATTMLLVARLWRARS